MAFISLRDPMLRTLSRVSCIVLNYLVPLTLSFSLRHSSQARALFLVSEALSTMGPGDGSLTSTLFIPKSKTPNGPDCTAFGPLLDSAGAGGPESGRG